MMDGSWPEVSMRSGATPVAGDNPAPEKPGRLILYAFGWMLACEMAAALVSFTYTFIAAAMGRKTGIPSYISYPLSILPAQTVYLLSALHRGRIMAGGGSSARALGDLPMKHRWPMIAVGVVILLWAGMLAWARIVHPPPVPSAYAIDMNSALATGGWVTVIIVVLALVILAPVAEELFFRGWLWEGLRCSWRPVPVMVGTALPWLLVHVLDYWTVAVALILLPAAICFSLVRHFCGSIRASIALHILYNLIAIGSSVWFFKRPV